MEKDGLTFWAIVRWTPYDQSVYLFATYLPAGQFGWHDVSRAFNWNFREEDGNIIEMYQVVPFDDIPIYTVAESL